MTVTDGFGKDSFDSGNRFSPPGRASVPLTFLKVLFYEQGPMFTMLRNVRFDVSIYGCFFPTSPQLLHAEHKPGDMTGG